MLIHNASASVRRRIHNGDLRFWTGQQHQRIQHNRRRRVFRRLESAARRRFSVILTNTGDRSSKHTCPVERVGLPRPATVPLRLYNESGAIIGTATTFTLTSGQIAQVSLPYASQYLDRRRCAR